MTPPVPAQLPAPDARGSAGATAALLVATLVVSLLSGFASAWLTARTDRRRHRRDVVRGDVDRALDALAALRDAYRAGWFGGTSDGLTLRRLEDALELAVLRTTAPVADAAHRYVTVARSYAAGDENSGDRAERSAFEALAAALVAERNAYG